MPKNPVPAEKRRREGGSAKSGAVSHRPLPAVVTLAGRNVPVDPPAALNEFARELWLQVVRVLAEANIIDGTDLPALTNLCNQWARSRAAGELIDAPVDPAALKALDARLEESETILSSVKTRTLARLNAGVDVTASDLNAIAKLEVTVTNLRLFRDMQARYGNLVALGSTGQLVESPLLGIEKDGAALFLRYADHFGLTAVARTKLGILGLEGRSLQKDLEDALGSGRS